MSLARKAKRITSLMPQFAHTTYFSYSRTEGGPPGGCRVTLLAETWQLLPPFHDVDAFLQNSFLTFHADIQCPQVSF